LKGEFKLADPLSPNAAIQVLNELSRGECKIWACEAMVVCCMERPDPDYL